MPRTKKLSRTSRTSKKQDENTHPNQIDRTDQINAYIKDYDANCKKHLQQLKMENMEVESDIALFFHQLRMSIPNNLGNKTLKQLMEHQEQSTHLSSTNFTSSDSIFEAVGSMVKQGKKNNTKRSLSLVNDEGYLTVESNESNSGGRQSRSKTKKTVSKRNTRSLSRSKIQQSVGPRSTYKTPLTKHLPQGNTFGMVTPKVKPNTPQVILRRPKEGEMAISMQGSPLLVNPVVSNAANVNIPLDDGRTISIQPARGLRMSQFPEIPPDVRRQIETLRDNLIKVCRIPK